MTKPLSVGVAGLGTVGAGVLRLLRDNASLIEARAGRPIVVSAVAARDRTRDRGVSTAGLHWYDDASALASDPALARGANVAGGHLVHAGVAEAHGLPSVPWEEVLS